MGFFDSFGDKHFEVIDSRLTTIDSRLLTLIVMFLESEKYRAGITSDDEYKKWLNGIDKSLWNSFDQHVKIMEAQ